MTQNWLVEFRGEAGTYVEAVCASREVAVSVLLGKGGQMATAGEVIHVATAAGHWTAKPYDVQ